MRMSNNAMQGNTYDYKYKIVRHASYVSFTDLLTMF